MAFDVSIVIPIYNEAENIPNLLDQLSVELGKLGKNYEIIAVDDGSVDASVNLLKERARTDNRLRVLKLRRNSGQTAAIMAGIDHAKGAAIVTIDADLQNDPADIGLLLAKLDEGYDVVSGWRKDRQDAALSRNFVSRVANWIIVKASGVDIHDYGCTLKAYRREIIQEVRLYGEMHRFIPIYASWQGGRVTELPVRHHARRFGASNYGLERIVKVLLDLVVIMFFDRYFSKPIYVFGTIALALLSGSVLIFFWMLYLRIFEQTAFIETPLPILAAITASIGLISFLIGLLAEVLMRTYFESQDRKSYLISERINFESSL